MQRHARYPPLYLMPLATVQWLTTIPPFQAKVDDYDNMHKQLAAAQASLAQARSRVQSQDDVIEDLRRQLHDKDEDWGRQQQEQDRAWQRRLADERSRGKVCPAVGPIPGVHPPPPLQPKWRPR